MRVTATRTRRYRGMRTQRGRRLIGVASGVALAVGLLCAWLGYLVQSTPEDRTAEPMRTDTAYVVGDRVPFVGSLVVYGAPQPGERPGLSELGCRVTEGGGPLSTEAAVRQDRVVVDGRALVPLLQFPGVEGHAVVCTGSAAVAAAPLYVVPGATPRDLVPLAGYCAAALLVPLAVLGVTTLVATRP